MKNKWNMWHWFDKGDVILADVGIFLAKNDTETVQV